MFGRLLIESAQEALAIHRGGIKPDAPNLSARLTFVHE
jgi:hypothetical protein